MRKLHTLLLAIPVIAAASGGTFTYRYWFDNLPDKFETRSLDVGASTIEADAAELADGFHTVCLTLIDEDGVPSSIATAPFIRFSGLGSGNCRILTLIDGKDERVESVSASGGNISYQLDVNELPYGLHMLSAAVITEAGNASGLRTAAFYRTPTATEMRGAKCHYLIDGKEAGTTNADVSTGTAIIEIDVDELPIGLHELSMFISDGNNLNSPIVSKLFMKIPGGITEYRYWLNNDITTAVSTKFDSPQMAVKVIDMWEVPEMPFRTDAFACQPNHDGSLTLHSQNDLTAMFICKDANATIFDTHRYTDSRVSRPVAAEDIFTLAAGVDIRERLEKPNANQIIWRKFFAEPGQLVRVKASIACMIDIWNEKGEKIVSITGNDTTNDQNIEISEQGIYFIALHGFSKAGNSLDITYTNLARHAIVTQYPSKSSNKGVLMVTIDGNGFDELEQIYLSGQDSELQSTWIYKDTSNKAEIRFDLDGVPLGDYVLKAQFRDSISGELKNVTGSNICIDTEKTGDLNIKLLQARTSGKVVYSTIQLTNNSNNTLLYVPLNLAAERPANGCYVQFVDFIPGEASEADSCVVYTENLLGKEVRGGMYAGLVPYIQPYETLTFDIGIYADPRKWTNVDLYAWCGEAWSEEYKRILSDDFTIKESDFYYSNQLTLTKLMIMETLHLLKTGELRSSGEKSTKRRAPALQQERRHYIPRDEDLAITQEILSSAVENSPFSESGNAAEAAKNISVATGLTIGGIENGLLRRNINEYARVCGIDLENDESYSTLKKIDDTAKKNMPPPSQIVLTAIGQDDVYDMVKDYEENAASCSTPMPSRQSCFLQMAVDPNDMLGYVNPAGGRHVGIGIDELTYTIEFENDPEAGATASALTVEVENQLDGEVFDLTTFRPLELTIGDKTVDLPADHSFVKTVDLRPQINTIAQVELDYNAAGGKAVWRLSSLDPITMEPTDYFEQGLLPVNDSISHCGEGMITYSIGLKPNLADGTQLKNKAKIIFDDNAPIETPEWVNITDYTLPTSQLTTTTDDRRTFRFAAEGEDSGAGVWRYALFMRFPGEEEWRILNDGIDANVFELTFEDELPAMTTFAALATDGAGNEQDNTFMQLKLGDVDRSGKVDSNDVIALARHYMGHKVSIERFVSDINTDGSIDIQDAMGAAHIYLQQSIDKFTARTRKYPRK